MALSFVYINLLFLKFQMWLNSLKEHISYNTHYIHTGEMLRTESSENVPLVTMQEALKVCKCELESL